MSQAAQNEQHGVLGGNLPVEITGGRLATSVSAAPMPNNLYIVEEMEVLSPPEPIRQLPSEDIDSDFNSAIDALNESDDRIPYEQIRTELDIE